MADPVGKPLAIHSELNKKAASGCSQSDLTFPKKDPKFLGGLGDIQFGCDNCFIEKISRILSSNFKQSNFVDFVTFDASFEWVSLSLQRSNHGLIRCFGLVMKKMVSWFWLMQWELSTQRFSTRERKLIVSDTDSVSIQVVTWNARNSDSKQTESGGQFRCAPEFRVWISDLNQILLNLV